MDHKQAAASASAFSPHAFTPAPFMVWFSTVMPRYMVILMYRDTLPSFVRGEYTPT